MDFSKDRKNNFNEHRMQCENSSICCIREMFALKLMLSYDDVSI